MLTPIKMQGESQFDEMFFLSVFDFLKSLYPPDTDDWVLWTVYAPFTPEMAEIGHPTRRQVRMDMWYAYEDQD